MSSRGDARRKGRFLARLPLVVVDDRQVGAGRFHLALEPLARAVFRPVVDHDPLDVPPFGKPLLTPEWPEALERLEVADTG